MVFCLNQKPKVNGQTGSSLTVTQILACYDNAMQKSLSELSSLNLEVDGLQQQETKEASTFIS